MLGRAEGLVEDVHGLGKVLALTRILALLEPSHRTQGQDPPSPRRTGSTRYAGSVGGWGVGHAPEGGGSEARGIGLLVGGDRRGVARVEGVETEEHCRTCRTATSVLSAPIPASMPRRRSRRCKRGARARGSPEESTRAPHEARQSGAPRALQERSVRALPERSVRLAGGEARAVHTWHAGAQRRVRTGMADGRKDQASPTLLALQGRARFRHSRPAIPLMW